MTSQAESAPGAIDHLKITGGMGTSRQESAADTVGSHYAVTQDLRWAVGAIREMDLDFDFAGGITDPEEIGSVPP